MEYIQFFSLKVSTWPDKLNLPGQVNLKKCLFADVITFSPAIMLGPVQTPKSEIFFRLGGGEINAFPKDRMMM